MKHALLSLALFCIAARCTHIRAAQPTGTLFTTLQTCHRALYCRDTAEECTEGIEVLQAQLEGLSGGDREVYGASLRSLYGVGTDVSLKVLAKNLRILLAQEQTRLLSLKAHEASQPAATPTPPLPTHHKRAAAVRAQTDLQGVPARHITFVNEVTEMNLAQCPSAKAALAQTVIQFAQACKGIPLNIPGQLNGGFCPVHRATLVDDRNIHYIRKTGHLKKIDTNGLLKQNPTTWFESQPEEMVGRATRIAGLVTYLFQEGGALKKHEKKQVLKALAYIFEHEWDCDYHPSSEPQASA